MAAPAVEGLHEAVDEIAHQLGYKELKTEQKDIIIIFVQGRDVFVALLTGFRKSLVLNFHPFVSREDNKCLKLLEKYFLCC